MNRPQEIDIMSRYTSDRISEITGELSTMEESLSGWTDELLETDDELLLDSISAAHILVIKAIKQLIRAAAVLHED